MTPATTAVTSPVRPGPRLSLPPRTEPSYDDEIRPAAVTPAHSGATQGTLALTFTLPSGLATRPVPAPPAPPAPPAQPRLRLVPGETGGPARGLPDPQAWAGTLAQAVVEVLAGDRPVGQLLRWTTAGIYANLSRRAALATRERTAVRAGRPRAVVRRVHVSQPKDGVAEASAVLSDGPRTRAMALRLQHADGRWLCTALELG
jgi:hypothetical protein